MLIICSKDENIFSEAEAAIHAKTVIAGLYIRNSHYGIGERALLIIHQVADIRNIYLGIELIKIIADTYRFIVQGHKPCIILALVHRQSREHHISPI